MALLIPNPTIGLSTWFDCTIWTVSILLSMSYVGAYLFFQSEKERRQWRPHDRTLAKDPWPPTIGVEDDQGRNNRAFKLNETLKRLNGELGFTKAKQNTTIIQMKLSLSCYWFGWWYILRCEIRVLWMHERWWQLFQTLFKLIHVSCRYECDASRSRSWIKLLIIDWITYTTTDSRRVLLFRTKKSAWKKNGQYAQKKMANEFVCARPFQLGQVGM
jgi:hypothetical protein